MSTTTFFIPAHRTRLIAFSSFFLCFHLRMDDAGLPNLASFHATHSFAAYFLSLALPSAGAFLGAAAIAASIFAPVLAASTTVKVKDKNLKAASTDNDRGWLRYLRLRFESTFLLGLMRAIFALMWLIYAVSYAISCLDRRACLLHTPSHRPRCIFPFR